MRYAPCAARRSSKPTSTNYRRASSTATLSALRVTKRKWCRLARGECDELFKPKLRSRDRTCVVSSATGLINGGFVQRNVETISQLRGRDPASGNDSSAATSIGYSRTPRRKLLRVTIRGNWRECALQRIGGRPRSSAIIRVESPMSASGQKRTFHNLFDQPIGAAGQGQRDVSSLP